MFFSSPPCRRLDSGEAADRKQGNCTKRQWGCGGHGPLQEVRTRKFGKFYENAYQFVVIGGFAVLIAREWFCLKLFYFEISTLLRLFFAFSSIALLVAVCAILHTYCGSATGCLFAALQLLFGFDLFLPKRSFSYRFARFGVIVVLCLQFIFRPYILLFRRVAYPIMHTYTQTHSSAWTSFPTVGACLLPTGAHSLMNI